MAALTLQHGNRLQIDNTVSGVSSNTDYETMDLNNPSTSTRVCQRQIQISIGPSPYEQLDINTQEVIRSEQVNPYEELSNDVWIELFPLNINVMHRPTEEVLSSYEAIDNTTPVGTPEELVTTYEELQNDVWTEIFPLNLNAMNSQEAFSSYEALDSTTQVVVSEELVTPYEQLTNDVWGEIFPLNVTHTQEALSNLSSYETLDITTDNITPQQVGHYEELNTDIWREIFPFEPEQIAVIQLQPISAIFNSRITTQNEDPLTNESCRELFNNEQTEVKQTCMHNSSLSLITPEASPVGHYQTPSTISEIQFENHSTPSRPLPVIPLASYASLNTVITHPIVNKRSRRMPILISKILIVVTLAVISIVTAVVTTVVILNKANDENLTSGKLNLHPHLDPTFVFTNISINYQLLTHIQLFN